MLSATQKATMSFSSPTRNLEPRGIPFLQPERRRTSNPLCGCKYCTVPAACPRPWHSRSNSIFDAKSQVCCMTFNALECFITHQAFTASSVRVLAQLRSVPFTPPGRLGSHDAWIKTSQPATPKTSYDPYDLALRCYALITHNQKHPTRKCLHNCWLRNFFEAWERSSRRLSLGRPNSGFWKKPERHQASARPLLPSP